MRKTTVGEKSAREETPRRAKYKKRKLEKTKFKILKRLLRLILRPQRAPKGLPAGGYFYGPRPERLWQLLEKGGTAAAAAAAEALRARAIKISPCREALGGSLGPQNQTQKPLENLKLRFFKLPLFIFGSSGRLFSC
jgi:hypothetical protein